MFNDQLASFTAIPIIGDVSSLLGELAFTNIQLPFKQLDMANSNSELKPVDIRTDFDFVLPLDNGQCIVTFKWFNEKDGFELCFTQINSFDLSGRLIGSSNGLRHHVDPKQVAQCGPNEFVVCGLDLHNEMKVFDSRMTNLRQAKCRNYANICCNSKFVFGLWDASDKHNYGYASDSDSDDDDDDDDEEEDYRGNDYYKQDQVGCSSQRIQACHLDTLRSAFCLLVPEEFTIERILADEQHVVAMSRLHSETGEWFMSIFDWQLASAETNGNKSARKFVHIERHIELTLTGPLLLFSAFLLDGWLVVPRENANELTWFDKGSGKRSKTSTKFNTSNMSKLQAIYSSGSSLFFEIKRCQLCLKRI